jgi:nucleoside-diphosphate-sugar epimerase
MVLQSDPSLARKLLDWESAVSLEDGLALTADWMRENLSSFTPSEYAV